MRPGADGEAVAVDRGQLGFDFLVGMSVFLITVAFVIGFVPGMFDPFATDTGANNIVADRTAAHLSGNVLVASPDEPGILNTTCTSAYFDTGSIPSSCRFDSRDQTETLGIHRSLTVNVTIQDGNTIRNLGGVDLRTGPTPTSLNDVTVAQRTVFLDGETSRLYVRVW